MPNMLQRLWNWLFIRPTRDTKISETKSQKAEADAKKAEEGEVDPKKVGGSTLPSPLGRYTWDAVEAPRDDDF